MKYRYLFFDLDGTLVYSHEGIYACFRYALKKMGKASPSDEDLRKCVGPPLEDSFQRIFGMDGEGALKASAYYREEYRRTGMYACALIPGVKEALQTLKDRGFVLAIATSKVQSFATSIAERLGVAEYFQEIVGRGEDGSLFTKAEVIEEGRKRLGASAEDSLMIGDRKQDADGAKANGMDCALLQVGYAEAGELASCGSCYVFDNFEQLTDFLRE